MVNTATLLFQLQGKPISINDAFQGRRFKTADCKKYEQDVMRQLTFKPMLTGWVMVDFLFYLPPSSYALSDISNLVKILEDCIVKKGYIEDDRKIVEMRTRKTRSENPRVEVYIKQCEEINYEKIR